MDELSLTETMTRAGACREFVDRDVPDSLLHRIFETARFAPSGGNRQPTRFVVVRDPQVKKRLGEIYVDEWEPYVQGVNAGKVGADVNRKVVDAADRFARSFHEIPVLIMVCADLSLLRITDTGLGRPSVVGGASVYPFVQNVLLLLRQAGVGASMTTLLCTAEPEIKEMLKVPEEFSVVGTLAIGWPKGALTTRLRRLPVSELLFTEQFGIPLDPGKETSE